MPCASDFALQDLMVPFLHPGDSAEVHRIPVSWTVITVVHGVFAVLALLLAAVVVVVAGRAGDDLVRRRATILLALPLMMFSLVSSGLGCFGLLFFRGFNPG